jgi:hypothetical protein
MLKNPQRNSLHTNRYMYERIMKRVFESEFKSIFLGVLQTILAQFFFSKLRRSMNVYTQGQGHRVSQVQCAKQESIAVASVQFL